MTHAAVQLMALEDNGTKAVYDVDAAAANAKWDLMIGGRKDEHGGIAASATPSGWPFPSAAFDSFDLTAKGPAAVAAEVVAAAEIVAAVDVDAFASDVAVVADVSAVLDAVVDANFSAAADVVAADVAAYVDAIASALC